MSRRFSVWEDGGVWHVAGFLNENTDFSPVRLEGPEVVLDLGKVTAINSIGTMRFMRFLGSDFEGTFVFRNCSSAFVDAMFLFPGLKGPEERPVRLESLSLAFGCDLCKNTVDLVVEAKDIGLEEERVTLPERACPRCQKPLAVVFDFEEIRDLLS